MESTGLGQIDLNLCDIGHWLNLHTTESSHLPSGYNNVPIS